MKSSYASSEKHYCEGILSCPDWGGHYVLGINLSVGVAPKRFTHDGSSNLDAINAFDKAEVAKAHLGQINLITVSSFCGPRGLIWGYDICKTSQMPNEWGIDGAEIGQPKIKIHSLRPLVAAFTGLTGTVDRPRFPFLPGSHVPCAMKSITHEGTGHIYAAQACAIPQDRRTSACLLMEDFGTLPDFVRDKDEYIRNIIINLAKSVLAIGKNQNVNYREIFVGIEHAALNADEIGCAMVAAPYFLPARMAFPDSTALTRLSYEKWERAVQKFFLYSLSGPGKS